MSCNCVCAEALPVLDNDFFTENRFIEWYNMMLSFSEATINELREQTGNIRGVAYEINTVLLQEVVYDAMIGLKTIVVSENNKVCAPNPFKIASYLGYWFLRHKPILFRVENNLKVDELVFADDMDAEERERIIFEMKHLNEVTVANFLLRYIFKVESAKPLCSNLRFKFIKSKGCIYFTSFKEMLATIYEKLTYHLTYRDISPKIIEHFLEAYTLHPYMPYTCDLWNTEEENQ